MKLLVSAYSCETGRGSEGEIGWRLVHRLAERHDVWVITRANLSEVHEKAFMANPKPERLHFVYFDLPWILRFYKKGARFFLLYYYIWQLGVAMVARRLATAQQFDFLHHLIGGMDWMPSGLALVPGKFVWGPVGSENTHPVIYPFMSLSSRLKDRLRLVTRWVMRHGDPFVRFTGARASVILTHTPETMPARYRGKLRPFTQTGIENSPELVNPKKDLGRASSLRLIFAGELKDWKGARLALDAALKFFEAEPNANLRIIGNGPLKFELEEVVRTHPQGHRVTMLGKLSMLDLTRELADSDVFLYPSFHHGLATVVLQAMLTGLPVVCIEGDATARVVGSRAGLVATMSKGSHPELAISEKLKILAEDELLRISLAKAARDIAVNEYSYDELAKEINNIYKSLA